MKAKKFIALAMSVAMAVGTASLFAACNPGDSGETPGANYEEDTRIWYAVGKDTKGTLKNQGWNQNDSTYAFVRDTTVTDENVFTLSLDIYAGSVAAGNSFKFLYKTSEDETNVPWTRQVGMHAFAGMDGYEGEDLDQVIKIDGETVFTTAQDNGDNGNNIACEKGQDGTYKFTLKTMSSTDTPKITVERTAKIEVPYDMYLRGDMNNFNSQTNTMVAMTENLGEGSVHTTWTADLEVTNDHLWRDADGNEVPASSTDNLKPDGTGEYAAVQLYNDIDKLTYVTGESDTTYKKVDIRFSGKDYSVMLLPKGDYTITFDAVDKSVSIVKYAHKMYFSGAFNNDKPTAADMLNKGNDVWTGYLTIDADAANPEKETAVTLYDSVTKTNTDPVNLKAGTYAFKYTESTAAVAYEALGYWLVGSFVDSRTDANVNFAISEGITPRFEEGSTAGSYTATVKATDVTTRDGYSWIKTDAGNTDNGVFAVQVVYGTALMGVKDWNSSGANQYLPAGVWEVTFAGGPVTWAEGDEANVPTPPALQYEMYLTGSFNGWTKGDQDYKLNYNNGTWVGYLNVTTDETEVKLYNKTTDTHFTTAELGNDNITLNKGYYMFVFLENGNEVKYDVVDFYVIGSFFKEDGSQLSFDVLEGVTPKFVAGTNENEIVVTYTVIDTTAVAENAYNFSGWGAGSDNAIFVWKPIATCSLAEYSGNYAGTKMWDLTPGANNFLSEAGEYTFTYNVATKALSATLAGAAD